MTNPDTLLAELRSRLAGAEQIHDLDVRARYYGVIALKASIALAVDPMSQEQRDALVALNQLANQHRDECARALPPLLQWEAA